MTTDNAIYAYKRVKPHTRADLLYAGDEVGTEYPGVKWVVAWVLGHIDGVPVARVSNCKHEVKHGAFTIFGLGRISFLLEDAGTVGERIANWGIELGNDGLQQGPGRIWD